MGDDRGETGGPRWFVVQLIALVFGLFFAFFLFDAGNPGTGETTWTKGLVLDADTKVPWWIVGALASGGSSFWKDLLGILNDLKHVQSTVRKERELISDQHASGNRQKAFNAKLIGAGQPKLGTDRTALPSGV